jgi:ParB family chromosome partitioning protein
MQRLVDDIKANGLQCPITLFEDQILDGRNRAIACQKAKVEPDFEEVTGVDPAAFVVSMNLRRRHLDETQRAMVAARLAPRFQGVKREQDERAAELLNVGRSSVEAARAVLDTNNPVLIRAVDDGRDVLPVSQAAVLAKLDTKTQNETVAKVRAGAKPSEAVPHVSHNSGENEWYTPPEYLEAARAVLGKIDLDPASSRVANERVKASRIYTAKDDGLSKQWKGRVWMNPPYAQPLITDFCERLVAEYEAGRVKAAVALVNNGTETGWGQRLLAASSAVCFPKGRIRFIDPEGKPSGAPLQGQMVVYLGDNKIAFRAAFKPIGVVR